jgi:enoyl-CoA hydratase
MEMILTGSPITAEEAYKWGLVNQVTLPEEITPVTLKLASRIISKSPLMVKWSKKCVNLGDDHDLYKGIDKELTQFSQTFETHDAKEGTAAFLEKRRPVFLGR